MSISLDFALFLRNSKTKLNLSVTARCVAYTLAFRVGSNSNAWISQKTLADEVGLSESSLRVHCQNLAKSGLILIKSSGKDKRKNVYSFVKEIVNYHSMNDAQKKKCHLKLGDTFLDTAYYQAVSTAYYQAVSDVIQTPEDPVEHGLPEIAQIPKATIESNIKSKATYICAKEIAQNRFEEFWFLYPRKKDKARAKEIWVKQKCEQVSDEIFKDIKNRVENDQQWKDKQFIPYPHRYLKFARWTDEVDIQLIKNEKKSGTELAYERGMKALERLNAKTN